MKNSTSAVKPANTNTVMADLVTPPSDFVPTKENLFDTSLNRFMFPLKGVKGITKKQAIENLMKYSEVSYPVGGDYNSEKWQTNIKNLNVSNQSLLIYCLVRACYSYGIKVSYKAVEGDKTIETNIDHAQMKLDKDVSLWVKWRSIMGYSYLSMLAGEKSTNSQAVAGLILLLKNGLKFS